MEPTEPRKLATGRTTRKPRRMSEGAFRPLEAKSASPGLLDGLIEADNLLMNLRAHPADQEVSVRRHESEYNSWPILYLPIGLR